MSYLNENIIKNTNEKITKKDFDINPERSINTDDYDHDSYYAFLINNKIKIICYGESYGLECVYQNFLYRTDDDIIYTFCVKFNIKDDDYEIQCLKVFSDVSYTSETLSEIDDKTHMSDNDDARRAFGLDDKVVDH